MTIAGIRDAITRILTEIGNVVMATFVIGFALAVYLAVAAGLIAIFSGRIG